MSKRGLKHIANRGVRLLLAFLLGQIVQIVLHAVCFDFWEMYQIPFCAAGGFLIAVAVFCGMRIAVKETETTHYEDMQ